MTKITPHEAKVLFKRIVLEFGVFEEFH